MISIGRDCNLEVLDIKKPPDGTPNMNPQSEDNVTDYNTLWRPIYDGAVELNKLGGIDLEDYNLIQDIYTADYICPRIYKAGQKFKVVPASDLLIWN